ncbi:MAG TPA: hypothetical protein VGL77_02055 [Armatimonadota bacterium]|jgi:hypothetical protein
MNAPLTRAQVKEIRDRAEKAVPAPWGVWRNHPDIYYGEAKENTPSVLRGYSGHVARVSEYEQICTQRKTCKKDSCEECKFNKKQVADTAQFIAHSREDVPALLDTIEAMGKIIADLVYEMCSDGGHLECPLCGRSNTRIGGGSTAKWHDTECTVMHPIVQSWAEVE